VVQNQQLLDGRYRLEDRLGAGGMSVVWKARDEVLDRFVAVKVLAGPHATDPAARQRVRAEAQAAARLWHPNITDVYDYGESTSQSGQCVPYVVMELLPGRTLSQRLLAGPLPPRTALRICAEVAAALAAAHARNLVHRDVTPANVMLTPSGAKVVDFGIAAVAGQPELDGDGQLPGTPAYLAPERLAGGEVLPASDVYALGLLIYRTLADHLPWQAETTTQMLTAHVYVEPAPLPPIDDVPSEVNQVCNRCLAKNPADRPSAGKVAAVLADAAGIVPPTEDERPAPVVPTAPASTAGPAASTGPAAPGGPAGSPEPAGPGAGPAGPGAGPAGSGGGPADGVPGAGTGGGRRRRVRVLIAAALVAAAVGLFAALAAPGTWRGAVIGGGVRPPGSGAVPPGSTSAGPTASAAPTSPGAARDGRGTRPSDPAGAADPGGASSRGPDAPGAGPGPDQPPPGGASGTPSTGPGVPVAALGGIVRVACTGQAAKVLGVTATPGYTVDVHEAGPADEIRVVFASPVKGSDVKVRCDRGVPVPTIGQVPL
jgi:serine/threonine-protein kinase